VRKTLLRGLRLALVFAAGGAVGWFAYDVIRSL
jgi:predicted acylesterase/phospholipase RssA